MLCIIEKYRLCEFHLNALAWQKGEFCVYSKPEQVLSKFLQECFLELVNKLILSWEHLLNMLAASRSDAGHVL